MNILLKINAVKRKDKKMQVKDRRIGKRIEKLRGKLAVSQKAFGAAIGVSQQYIGALEDGKRQPSIPVGLAICYQFGLNRSWLLQGQGKMFGH